MSAVTVSRRLSSAIGTMCSSQPTPPASRMRSTRLAASPPPALWPDIAMRDGSIPSSRAADNIHRQAA
jgi:hypothetical protein